MPNKEEMQSLNEGLMTAAVGRPIKGLLLREPDGGAWQQSVLAQRLAEALRHPDELFEDFHFTATFPGVGARSLLLYGRAITSYGTQTGWLLLGMQEIGQEQLSSIAG